MDKVLARVLCLQSFMPDSNNFIIKKPLWQQASYVDKNKGSTIKATI